MIIGSHQQHAYCRQPSKATIMETHLVAQESCQQQAPDCNEQAKCNHHWVAHHLLPYQAC